MRKMCKKLILISVFFNIFYILISGINNQVVYAAPNSINETMSKEEIMDKYYELKKDNQELTEKYDKLNGEWSSEKDSIDNRVDKIEIIGTSILVILGASVYRMVKGIDKEIKLVVENKLNEKVPLVVENEVNNKVPKVIAEKVEIETERIRRMVDDCKKEEKLMKEKNILIISEDSEKQKEIKKILKKFNKITDFRLGDELYDLNKYDVILFNNIDGASKKEELNEIIKNNDNINAVYFYFNKERKIFDSEKPDNTNFANANSTLVGNLLDLMKYQDDILNNEED